MDKVLLHIKVPPADWEFDFWVPKALSIRYATRLIAKLIEDQVPAFFSDGSQVALYYAKDGTLLDLDTEVGSAHLANGSYLYCF
ncbi:MAG: hypothetical protein LBK67_06760 [Coriobacteriales bacterium]|jgi:hypothetical protein|nr:hypothetical protein [Coriobacteriales bacterium]